MFSPRFLVPTLLSATLLYPIAIMAQDGSDAGSAAESDPDVVPEPVRPKPAKDLAIFSADQTVTATLHTTAGDVPCRLNATEHQAAVASFVALARGILPWLDASGARHSDPYYRDIPFAKRKAGAFASIGDRPEGTGFIIPDGRRPGDEPKAGALAMLHPWPGNASAQFMLLAADLPIFQGMYEIIGTCDAPEVIQKLTEQPAKLISVSISVE